MTNPTVAETIAGLERAYFSVPDDDQPALAAAVEHLRRMKEFQEKAAEHAPLIIQFCDYVEHLQYIAGVSGEVELEEWVRRHAAALAEPEGK